ncbi:tyrosine-type recombinase/integrase [Acutalibacter caecimuris]|uniref:tyrosine-type recombinase/integrase n=1 Tax=Acutalibacter caecimuris TaxID=3093657 RepID=UPI002AC986C5|nr:tyrosine-type recombinase/integrase [Acutalibacter sp. M00118]
MKNPNGFGTVVKLSGNRRNPYAVRKTAGRNEKGYPIYINIGYAPTREQGLIMLSEYNKSPWDIDGAKVTFAQLFELWKEKRMPKLGSSNASSLCSAYKHCEKLYSMKYNQVKSYHMQDCIDGCGKGYSTQGAIKNLFGHLDRFALELDIITKTCSSLVTSDPIPETKKLPFTDKEIELLWENQAAPWVDTVLFFLYTGFRISEMLALKVSSVQDQEGIQVIVGGTKTEAGKNRMVPVHSKIVKIVKRHIELSQSGYLFEYNGKRISQPQYRNLWGGVMDKLDLHHTPHECRHTFRSKLDSAGGNKVCIDRLMGHKSKGTGERVYTHKTLSELQATIELIK